MLEEPKVPKQSPIKKQNSKNKDTYVGGKGADR